MNYTTELDAIDRKWGRPVTIDDCRRLDQKAAADLSDDDLVILENFISRKPADEARARREQARNPVPAEPAAPIETKAVRPANPVVTHKLLHRAFGAYTDALVDLLKKFERKDAATSIDRIEAVERRLAALEAKPHVRFCGVHEAAKAYTIGDAVTRSGSLWICAADTSGTPGEDFIGWRLAVKSGQAR